MATKKYWRGRLDGDADKPAELSFTGVSNNGGYAQLTGCTSHPYVAGDKVEVWDSTDYDGVWEVLSDDGVDSLTISAPYTLTKTGSVAFMEKTLTISSVVTHLDGAKVVTSSVHGLNAGEQLEIINCDIEAYDGIWQVVTVVSTTEFSIIATYTSAASSGTVKRYSPWMHEDGSPARKLQDNEIPVFGEMAELCPSAATSRFAVAYHKKHTPGNHWNCFAGMDQYGITLDGYLQTALFTGFVGCYMDSAADNNLVVAPLKIKLSANCQIYYQGGSLAYLQVSNNGSAAAVPLVVYDGISSGGLNLCSDGILAAFTKLLVIGVGGTIELHDNTESWLGDEDEASEGCIVDAIEVGSAAGNVTINIGEECSATPGSQLGSDGVKSWSTTEDSKTIVPDDGDPTADVDIGDWITFEYSNGSRDNFFVVSKVAATSITVDRPATKTQLNVYKYRKKTPIAISAVAGTFNSNSPLDLVNGGCTFNFGTTDLPASKRVDLVSLIQNNGSLNWRAAGRLHGAELNGGAIELLGDGCKVIGNGLESSDTNVLKIYGGSCNLGGGAVIELANAYCHILYHGGSLTMPKDVTIDYDHLLS